MCVCVCVCIQILYIYIYIYIVYIYKLTLDTIFPSDIPLGYDIPFHFARFC